MRIKYTQNKKDMKYGNNHFIGLMSDDAVKICDSNRKYKKWLYLLLFVICVLASALFFVGIKNDNVLYISVGATVFIITFLFEFIKYYICIGKNQCNVSVDERMRVNKYIEINLTENNLELVIPGVRTVYEWAHLNHYKLDSDYLTIGMTKYEGECIPLSIFQSDVERREFIDIVSLKVKNIDDVGK